MSALAPSVSERLEQRLDAVLSIGERIRMSFDLGSALLAGGLLAIAYLFDLFGDPTQRPLHELLKAIAALIISAPVFYAAIHGVFSGDTDEIMEQLVAVAVLAALVSGEFTTAVSIPLILNLGHFLEKRSALGAQAAIEGLRTLQGRSAMLLTADGERDVNPSTLQPGDIVVVRPGDVIPADGTIRKGTSAVNQSSITGESAAEEVGPGMRLFAGSINLTGMLEITVTGVGEHTALGRVLELLRSAEDSKTPAMRLVQRYAGFYVPIMLIAAATMLFMTRDMSRAVAMLVVACPGAFVLAGPTAMIAALAAASRLGILIKNTKFLEVLAEVDTVVFDKTGTVTLGYLEVVAVLPNEGTTEDELLEKAATCATGSRHPVSRAVMRAAELKNLMSRTTTTITVEETPGRGVRALTNDGSIFLGRGDWLRDLGFTIPNDSEHEGAMVWVAQENSVVGCLLLTDLPRPEALKAIVELRQLGLERMILLTGDRWKTAHQVAATLDLENVIAEVLPEQKLQTVNSEKAAGRRVMVVGDGVNDALALASGDVGIAMGAMGTDVALRSADVALMTNDLGRLPIAVRLSRQTRSTINVNLMVGAASSLLMVTLAAMGLVSPLFGAVLHNSGEIFVILNSARLLKFGQSH
jgi:heavy metal translocating P-type ATPase